MPPVFFAGSASINSPSPTLKRRHAFTYTLDTIITTIRKYDAKFRNMGIKHLWVFGSYARGEQRPDSDLDLLVEPEERFTGGYFTLVHMEHMLQDEFPGLELHMNFVDKTEVHPSVERDKILIF